MITLLIVFLFGVVLGHLETMRQVKAGHWEKYSKDNKETILSENGSNRAKHPLEDYANRLHKIIRG